MWCRRGRCRWLVCGGVRTAGAETVAFYRTERVSMHAGLGLACLRCVKVRVESAMVINFVRNLKSVAKNQRRRTQPGRGRLVQRL